MPFRLVSLPLMLLSWSDEFPRIPELALGTTFEISTRVCGERNFLFVHALILPRVTMSPCSTFLT